MLLQMNGLSVSFHTVYGKLDVLDGVSLYINKGEIVGIVGESGSGKSVTALSILRLLDRNALIHSGQILFQGQNLLSLQEKEMQSIRGKRIGMVFQEPMAALNPTMKIGKQLAYIIRKHRGVSTRKANLLALRALEDCKIKDPELVFHKYPFQLSVGMCQRVVIALAMASPPELLIADEPTTALDVSVQAQILNLLVSFHQERNLTYLFISHDLSVIRYLCDRVGVLCQGRLVEEQPAELLFQSPREEYTKRLLDSLPQLFSHE